MIDQPKPLLDHLLELRKRLIYSLIGFVIVFSICYVYSENIFQFLVRPLAQLLQTKGGGRRLIYTGLTEAFLTYIKVAAFAAAFISFPLMAIQVWRFIAPGLYHNERNLFIGLLATTPVLFLLGAGFAYTIIFPTAYEFFLSFESNAGHLPIQLEAKVNEYLSFVMRLIFAFGICFELPVVLTLLASVGLITAETLVNKWRIAVVVIFAISAFITPPDIVSMLGLALPLIMLYGFSIMMVKVLAKRRAKKDV
ncbi:twin-arginine translocase subunit TatC [Candidatus Finniella inopinata]|uniref:Sec-independent protein translocase protein TatC n=1 Tax=Candidatus Finniella inopinata TaxID=1696036 RepID=A0A4Q7DIZ8_9PROT|nr:twin-arginine translocase subunit TatC [Candidatus Finniella inopinata]RZI46105.1 twin-arginine translocase subunit TatC [Candidatus Finniella inopinata]